MAEWVSHLMVADKVMEALPWLKRHADKICKNKDFVPEGKVDDSLSFL